MVLVKANFTLFVMNKYFYNLEVGSQCFSACGAKQKISEVNTFVLKYLFQLLLNCAGGVYF